jgi:hypothetical protein
MRSHLFRAVTANGIVDLEFTFEYRPVGAFGKAYIRSKSIFDKEVRL